MPDPVMNSNFNLSERIQLMFEDPVTKQLMVDPWLYSDGYTYDRRTCDKLETSPMTRRPIYALGPNIGLRSDLFDAYPRQSERYLKRHNLPAGTTIVQPPALSAEQHDQLYSIQTTLDAARAARADRRAQLHQGLHEVELSPIVGVLKEHLAAKGNAANIKLTNDLCVTRRGLDGYNESCEVPRYIGIRGYLRRMDVTEISSIEHFFDALIVALGRAAESISDESRGCSERSIDPSDTSRVTGSFTYDTESGLASNLTLGTSGSTWTWTGQTGNAAPTGDVTSVSGIIQENQSGNNPIVPSPDIDTHTTFQVSEADGKLNVTTSMSGDGFPNAEAYVTDVAGTSVFLYGYQTPGGEMGPFYMLFGNGQANMGGSQVSITVDPSTGNFSGGVEANNQSMTIDDWNNMQSQNSSGDSSGEDDDDDD